MTWVVFGIVLIVVIIVSTTVTVRYTASNYTADDGLHYAPTDTRIIPVSNALCQGLELTVDKALSGYTASLSMLDSRPKLAGNERFNIPVNSMYLGPGDYEYYYFYMYPGSNFTVSACISDSINNGPATFNLIRGYKNFNNWIDDPYLVKDSFQINILCGSGNQSHVYPIKNEDYYYLIFEVDNYQMRSTRLNVHMSFFRTRYEVTNTSIGDTCSTVGGSHGASCSVSVPLSGKTAFLAVTPQTGTEIDWTDGIGLDTKCVPRAWMYVVIAFSVLIGLLMILVPVLALVVIKLRKKKATPAVSTAPATVTTGTEHDTAALLPTPPSTNPNFQPPPPKYGSEYAAPPEYKP